DTATTEIYTLSLHDALPISDVSLRDLERTVAWVRKQVAIPAPPPVDDEGNPIETSDGLPVEDDDLDPAGKLDDEDDPVLIRLCQVKRGGLVLPDGNELSWNHVAIDEAQ